MDNELPPSPITPEPPPPGGPAPAPSQAPSASAPPVLNPPRLPAAPRPKNRGWKIAVGILAVLLLFSLFNNFWYLAHNIIGSPVSVKRQTGPRLEESFIEYRHSPNNILVIAVEGIISSDMVGGAGNYSMVDFMRDQFKMAAEDTDIKAVILKVDSPGGEVLASDEIYHMVRQFQKTTGKPVVASMATVAASGGYYVSAPCRWIVANELTLTGSIGVIFHSFNYRGLLDKVGVRPEVYKSGQFKDMLSGDKKESDITPQERKMIQDLIDDTFQGFKKVVKDGRSWAADQNKNNGDDKGRALVSDWAEYADGRVISGKDAHKFGFVDELGNFEAAVKRTKILAGIPNANLVKYNQVFDFSDLFKLFGKTESTKLKVDVGLEMPKLKAGQLYYLSPMFVQ